MKIPKGLCPECLQPSERGRKYCEQHSGQKYRAVPTIVDGLRFASKKEARRYGELRLLEKAGQVLGLRRQVRYRLEVNGRLVTTYVADFVYREITAPEVVVVEDTKGFRPYSFRLKARLFLAVYGYPIRET